MRKIHPSKRGVHFIAIFEAVKGVFGLALAVGLFKFRHSDFEQFAQHLIEILHLDPTSFYAGKVIETAGKLHNTNLALIISLAVIYTIVRFIEAYGLWKLRAWAEWFAIISGSIYIPFEIYELISRPSLIHAGILVINILIVIYLYSFRREQIHEQEIHESQMQAALDASKTDF